MATVCPLDDTNEESTYRFRFGTTKKIIHLNKEELDRIPYFSLLVTHKNDFLSVRNEDGEYLLDSRIRYNWFLPIFQSIMTGHPSMLFTELPKKVNVWGMIQLYDYLCVNPIPVPLLKNEHLIRTKSDDIDKDKFRIEYRRAKDLLEVRDTAVEFIVSLARNEYNFDDSITLKNVSSLISIIISNCDIFGEELCHHTWIIVKASCFSLFSFEEQSKLDHIQQRISKIKTDSLKYLYNNDQTLPQNFENSFAWKGSYTPKEEKNTNRIYLGCRILFIGKAISGKSSLINSLIGDRMEPEYSSETFQTTRRFSYYSLMNTYDEGNKIYFLDTPGLETLQYGQVNELSISSNTEERKKVEAKSARSGHFNTLPKRVQVDRFKHRCGPKAQKHR